MCGICGMYAYGEGLHADADAGRAVRDAMLARGPDGCGEWLTDDGRVWLGHRRLAIIDLSSAGAQPMRSDDGALVLTYNGEIYNYAELRDRLKAEGAVFRGASDSEVLLHLYRRHGTAFVSKLRGMFAFAIWDAARRRLLLARDPFGVKPLYYSASAGTLRFASQVKALIADRAVSRRPSAAGVTGFFIFGSVPEPWTVYEDVKALPAGTILTIGRDGVGKIRAYHSIGGALRAAEEEGAAVGDPAEEMRAALLDSVRHHLVADVPVGAFLSAGVDSGVLVGLMRDAGQAGIRTVTLAYEEFHGGLNDEAPLAAATAQKYGAEHTTRYVSADEFHADLPRIFAAMDQPSIDGVNTWFVAKAAHELGLKVAVSGVGGDELFGGYGTFQTIPRFAALTRLAPALWPLSRLFESGVGAARRIGFGMHPKTAGLIRYGGNMPGAYLMQRGMFLPFELRGTLGDAEFVRDGLERLRPLDLIERALDGAPRTAFGQVAALEMGLYMRNQLLRDTDWAAMAHSLEVRTPYIDHVLLRRAAAVMCRPPGRRPGGKELLALAPQRPLPDKIVNRAKTGFGIPVQAWLSRGGSASLFSRDWAKRVAAFHDVLPQNCDVPLRQQGGVRGFE